MLITFYEQKMHELIRVALDCYTPVIAGLIYKGKIIYIATNNEKLHGEMRVILWSLERKLDPRHLTLLVTLEPCPMCMFMASINKINTVVYGAYNLKYGACSGKLNLLQMLEGIYQPNVVEGILDFECSIFIQRFFQNLR